MTSRSSSGTNAKGYMMYLNPTNNYLQYWKGTNSGGSWVKNTTTSQSTWKSNGGGDPGTPGWNYYVIRFNGSNQTDLFLDGALIKSVTSAKTMNKIQLDLPELVLALPKELLNFFLTGK